MIKLSFVICTYNNKELVKRCLDSIFSQNYKNFEVICVDGGSKDGTLNLLKKYKVKVIHNKKRFPEGPEMGKSQGVKKAKGERIALDRINLKDEERYYTYKINLENCLCTGGNVFLVRKNLLNKTKGYVQDVEMIYSLCLLGINKLAIPKNAFTHHLTVNSFKEFLKKRWYWAMHYNK